MDLSSRMIADQILHTNSRHCRTIIDSVKRNPIDRTVLLKKIQNVMKDLGQDSSIEKAKSVLFNMEKRLLK